MERSTKDPTMEIFGKSVSHVSRPDPQRVDIHFTEGTVLTIRMVDGHLTVALTKTGCGASKAETGEKGPQPTQRQSEYLDFIARYIARYGVSPAEADIARHFLVAAPSVNQMVQMLERRGFIRRQLGIARSITIVGDRASLGRPGRVAPARDPRPNNALHRTRARVARSGRSA